KKLGHYLRCRVIVQQVQERQGQSYSGTGYKSNATISEGNNASGQARVVKCYNRQGEGHMARQFTQPKRPRNATCLSDQGMHHGIRKAMLAEAHEAGQILDVEKLVFLEDPRVSDGHAVQIIILNNATFQTKDLDTYDFDFNDISNAKAILMANISNYGSNVISEVVSSADLPRMQVDLDCVHAEDELHLHGVCVVHDMHEAGQSWQYANLSQA
nr:hypothetical protein [Tanacetum cinerariifolium]